MALLTPPQRDQVGPSRRRPFSWGVGGGGRSAAHPARRPRQGTRACRRRRGRGGGARAEGVGAGTAGAPAVAKRHQQVASFPAAAARPLGRERPGVEWERVCASVCECVRAVAPPPPAPRSVPLARPGRAALSRVCAPFPPPPPPPFCELVSVTGARVTACPSGTDSGGRRRRRSRSGRSSWGPGRGTRARKPGPAEPGARRRAVLSAGEWETFLNRGSSPHPWRKGRLFTSFF